MSSDVFPGPFGPMPEAGAAAILWMPPQPDAPGPVRFVDGFEPFAEFARGQGTDPAVLAVDLAATWDVIAGHPEVLESETLATAAARFVGSEVATTTFVLVKLIARTPYFRATASGIRRTACGSHVERSATPMRKWPATRSVKRSSEILQARTTAVHALRRVWRSGAAGSGRSSPACDATLDNQ